MLGGARGCMLSSCRKLELEEKENEGDWDAR